MFDENTIQFVREHLAHGKSKEEIAALLRSNKWTDEGITALFNEVEGNTTSNSSVNTQYAQQEGSAIEGGIPSSTPQNIASSSVPGVFGLLGEMLSLLTERFFVFLGILVLPITVFFIVVFGVITAWGGLSILNSGTLGDNVSLGFMIVVGLLVIGFLIVTIWGAVALLIAISDRSGSLGVISSYKAAKGRIGSYIWVQFLVGAVTMGGFMLLIVPGVIFSVWFAFALYIFIDDDMRGTRALLASREYVRGRWWQIFGRMLGGGVILLITFVAIQLIVGLVLPEIVAGVLNYVVQMLLQIVMFVYIFVLYRNVKDRTRPVNVDEKKGWWLVVVAILGLLIIPAILFTVVLASLDKSNDVGADAYISSTINFARSDAEFYYTDNNDSYEGMCSEIEAAIREVDEINREGNVYCSSTKDNYAISADLIVGGSYCVDATFSSTSLFPNKAQPGLTCQ